MKFKIVEHTYPIFVLCVIYSLSASFNHHEKRNELQDTALEEINERLLLFEKKNELQDTALKEINERLLQWTTNNNINYINYESAEKLTKKNNKNHVHKDAEDKENGKEKKDTKLVNVDKDGVLSDKNGSTVNENCHHRNRANEDNIAQQHAQPGKSILKNRELQMEESTETVGKDDSGNSTETVLSFHHEEKIFNSSFCDDVEYTCGNDIFLLQQNTTQCGMYNQAAMISGAAVINDVSSPQSKSFCWMLQTNFHLDTPEVFDTVTYFTQRYVLAILHLMSIYGLFNNDEFPPNTHECEWFGIECKRNNTKIVTGISLSSSKGQIMNGTLFQELGSLEYLEKLDLQYSNVFGTIPQTLSNLKSLVKLNLSWNYISGTMPENLYRQLNKLEHIDLSENLLKGNIPYDMGSYSPLQTVFLNNNQLQGSLPLKDFNYNDLEALDISYNELSEVDLQLLLNHTKLKYLNLSNNNFRGSLSEHTFMSVSQLLYFNISQNFFSETIPTTFPELSNITYFDAHGNKFEGIIPLGISNLSKLKYLNLQGNQLTGSIPKELNQLEQLNTLVLSHNELKGSIPLDPNKLSNMNILSLHANELSGKAPDFTKIDLYISDCGIPIDSLDPVRCPTCNVCCNSDGLCQFKIYSGYDQTVIFMISMIAFIIILYSLKNRITSNKYLESFFSQTVACWNALILISDKSVYHFLLIDNKIGWFAAVCCGIFQTAIFLFFVGSVNMVNENNDREYTLRCPANINGCEYSIYYEIESSGISIFISILFIWVLRDIIGSVKLMLLSFQKRNIDFFFASAVVFFITMLSLWTSITYINAVATRSTDMVKDAVVLLFVIEIDERIFQLVESLNPHWVDAIDNNMRNSRYEGENLIIKTSVEKMSTSFSSMRKKMMCKRNPPAVEESIDVSGIEDFQGKAADESGPCKEDSNIVENTS